MTARIIVALVGLSALGAAVLLLVSGPDDFGAAAAPETSAQSASPRPTSSSPHATERPVRTPSPAVPPRGQGAPERASSAPTGIVVRSARAADVLDPPAPAPARITARGIDAPVIGVGVDPDGLMTVPEDIGEAGWYEFGPAPGQSGSAVIAGHVDSREQGLGAFASLTALRAGDEVVVSSADGGTTSWRVTARRTYDKASLPVAELYRRDGPPRLVLVTCGGDFDPDDRSYRANVVVVAEPIG